MGRMKEKVVVKTPPPLIQDSEARVMVEVEGKWVVLDWVGAAESMFAVSKMTEAEAEELGSLADDIRDALDTLWVNEVRVFTVPDGVKQTGVAVGGGYDEEMEDGDDEDGDVPRSMPGGR